MGVVTHFCLLLALGRSYRKKGLEPGPNKGFERGRSEVAKLLCWVPGWTKVKLERSYRGDEVKVR